MASLLEKAKKYESSRQSKHLRPVELKQLHDELLYYLDVLGEEYPLEKALVILHYAGHYPVFVCNEEGFGITEAIEEAELIVNDKKVSFAVITPNAFYANPYNALKEYITNLLQQKT